MQQEGKVVEIVCAWVREEINQDEGPGDSGRS